MLEYFGICVLVYKYLEKFLYIVYLDISKNVFVIIVCVSVKLVFL